MRSVEPARGRPHGAVGARRVAGKYHGAARQTKVGFSVLPRVSTSFKDEARVQIDGSVIAATQGRLAFYINVQVYGELIYVVSDL